MALALYSYNDDLSTCVAVVGLGLVGEPISNELALSAKCKHEVLHRHIDWSRPSSLLEPIVEFLENFPSQAIHIVWAAGKAGFTSSKSELNAEAEFFKLSITQLHQRLADKMSVSFISSAGGIYEHSGFVQEIGAVSATRPYAQAKLNQEQFLSELEVNHRIYRASTVYGWGGNRQGLISTMLRSAKFRKPMSIYADLNTIRDYVFNHDLAKKIVGDLQREPNERIQIAASGRGLSIATLIGMVEQVTSRRVLATFHPQTSNATDIYFSPQLVHQSYSKTSVEEGLRILHKFIN